MMCLMALAITSCDKDYAEPVGYVDLGLASGTKWKTVNETNPNNPLDFFNYDEAIEKFGSALPTKIQLDELQYKCQWTWDDTKKGYKVVGPNGKTIFLPAAGHCNRNGEVLSGGTGYYWSSTPINEDCAWSLIFNFFDVDMYSSHLWYGFSVRLVQNP